MFKKYLEALLLLMFFFTNLWATLYEDGEDGTTTKWQVYDASPAGATINNLIDVEKNSYVIELNGDGMNNGYMIGNIPDRENAWSQRASKTMRFDMQFAQGYAFYISVVTETGNAYLYYDTNYHDRGIIDNGYGKYIHHSLRGYSDGTWHTITLHLEEDLQEYEPNNHIIEVTGFLIRGSGKLDNIAFDDVPPPPPANDTVTLYEDGEDGTTTKWQVYDASPAGATINNLIDAEKNSYVIELNGDGMNNGYMIGNIPHRENAWSQRASKTMRFDMQFAQGYAFYISVVTETGNAYLYYDTNYHDRGIIDKGYGKYIHHSLRGFDDGTWHTITLHLEEDLQEYEPNNHIIEVTGFLVRGSGKLDNIAFIHSNTPPSNNGAKIFLIGDSTVHNDSQGEMGWGSALKNYMLFPDNAFNRARSGSSSKTYKDASASHHDWDYTKNLIQSEDISHGAYLFIQFGHNDEKDGYLHTEPGRFNSYYNELKVFIDEARDLGVTPVLVTSVSRQYKGSRTHGDYPQTMKDLAEDENVLLLDLEYKSFVEFDKYESTQAIQDVFSYDDGTHFNPTGANIVAGWVKELVCSSPNVTLCQEFK